MPERLRILRVITWLPVGGIERRLVALLPRLNRERFDVSLVCIRERGALADELEAAGIRVDCIPFRKRWDLSALRRLATLMRERRIDIVHSHMYRSNVPATVAARLAGVPTIFAQVHNVGTWETSRQRWMDRALCRWRTGMIAVSERVRQDIEQQLRIPRERIHVLRNGIELQRFTNARLQREELRRAHGLEPNTIVYLFAARLVPQKRPFDFVTAFARLRDLPGGEQVRAWILGDGPLRGELERQAASLGVSSAVQFFGRRSDVEEFMAAADVFVLPSEKEGFSNALIEAMAAGLPAIASDVGGNAEALRHETDGLIVPRPDSALLAEAMERLWRHEDERLACAAAAIRRAGEFSLERMIAQTEELYSWFLS